ncbi:hypothetical protein B7463_g11085, partial [Scytalidium lignicola]
MALQEKSANIQWPQYSKPGPKPKPLEERIYKPRSQPVTSARRSFTRERKIEVLKYLFHHKVIATSSPHYQKPRVRFGMPESIITVDGVTYQAVTTEEASQFWKIPVSTIKQWWLKREEILADSILQRLRSSNIIPALIPPGCTSLLQLLDIAVNSPFKQWLKEAYDEYIEDIESKDPEFKWTTSAKRIMTTFTVAKAAQRLEQEKRRFQDSQIKIKDIPNTGIDFTGWESVDYDVEYVKKELFMEVPKVLDDIEEVILGEERLPNP